ncbi:MAG TPA: Coenzyme F420 hydrogenase/dehydrogenase, beta subunit C-terminal domain [Actinomycetes bacterium]|nr:Coenzyme F420 hydrogenase/dehydrogenase, beta subunit C-terminal domain [Actinomycetes bacterium]
MAGFKIRDEMNDIDEAPGKIWFWELEQAVIDADRCVQCGACVAACPSDSIGVGADGLPKLVKMCTGCSLCWDFCPRGGMRHEATWALPPAGGDPGPAPANGSPGGAGAGEAGWKITGAPGPAGAGLGRVRDTYTARVRPKVPGAQDGGVVSALLIALLEAGDLDGALLARESRTEPWKGEPFLARTPAEVVECAGSFYNQTLALAALDLDGYDLPAQPRLAVVGTPCEVEAIRAMQSRPWTWGASRVDAVVLTVALLCTKSFNYEKLMVDEIRRRRGIPLERVGKVDVIHGRMIVEDHDGEVLVSEPVRDFHGAALKGCDECADFLGHAADISVGSVGSEDGYSSVLVRTPAGQAAFDRVRDRLELRDLDRVEALHKLDALNKKIAVRSLQRPFDPSAPLFVDFAEHVQRYAGTDRAPVVRDR